SDFEPLLKLRDVPASEIAERRSSLLVRPEQSEAYLHEFAELAGCKSFLNAEVNYSLLSKVPPNLYKCFIIRALAIGSDEGIIGLLHPEGIYDDPRGGNLRSALYPRLKMHCHFINELQLFPDIYHMAKYSVNVYMCKQASVPAFTQMSNLFHP